MPNPVQITQDADGTFIVNEPGQSPQKLTKNWADLDAFLRTQFRVYDETPPMTPAHFDEAANISGKPDPFDHDNSGAPGGSLPKGKRK